MSLFTIERISMTIGIDASRAFLKRRTGIEEYAYQTIKHLRSVIAETDTVVLYVRQKLIWDGFRVRKEIPAIDFTLPENWQVRGIWAPRFWTQIALSLEMLWRSPDVLFVPAHTVPLIHPAKQQLELRMTARPRQVGPTVLRAELARVVERDPDVGPVDLLLDDDLPVEQRPRLGRRQHLVAPRRPIAQPREVRRVRKAEEVRHFFFSSHMRLYSGQIHASSRCVTVTLSSASTPSCSS